MVCSVLSDAASRALATGRRWCGALATRRRTRHSARRHHAPGLRRVQARGAHCPRQRAAGRSSASTQGGPMRQGEARSSEGEAGFWGARFGDGVLPLPPALSMHAQPSSTAIGSPCRFVQSVSCLQCLTIDSNQDELLRSGICIFAGRSSY